MRSQKCSKCGTLLDISRLEKGSKFACATCGAVLIVGEAAPVKRSLREGPAFQPRAKKPETLPPVSPRRRRAEAAPAPRREPRAAGEAPPRSKLPLFAGLGGLAVSAIVIAVVLSRGGGPDGGPGGGVSGGGGGGASAAERWWDSVSAKVGSSDEAGLLKFLEEAHERGYTEHPLFWNPKSDEIHRALLKRNPDSEVANRYFGRKSLKDYKAFDTLWVAMNEHFKVLPERFRQFLARYEDAVDTGGHVWMDEASYAKAAAVLDDFRAWLEELQKDPSAEQVQKAVARARAFAKEFGSYPVLSRPFLVLLASRQLQQADESEAERSRVESARKSFEARGERVRKVLQVVAREFDRRYREPLGLEPVRKESVLRMWVGDDLSFYQRLVQNMSRGEARGEAPYVYFSPRTRWAYAYYPETAAGAADPIHDIGAIAVRELQWFYSRDPKKPFADYYREWNGWWFDIGLGEYLGAGGQEAGGEFRFTGFSPRAVAQLRKLKDNGWPLFPLRELVAQPTPQRFEQYWSGTFLPALTNDENIPDAVLDLMRAEPPGFGRRSFYAQAWYLAYFLNEYESGKYKQQYLDLLRTALRGRNKPAAYGSGRWKTSLDAFAEILGLDSPAAWKRIEEEYKGHLNSALSKAQ